MPRRRAAWWKKAAQMHFLMTSQSVPLLTSSIFWFSMISFSWARTSRTFRIALMWMKWSAHQLAEYLSVEVRVSVITNLIHEVLHLS